MKKKTQSNVFNCGLSISEISASVIVNENEKHQYQQARTQRDASPTRRKVMLT